MGESGEWGVGVLKGGQSPMQQPGRQCQCQKDLGRVCVASSSPWANPSWGCAQGGSLLSVSPRHRDRFGAGLGTRTARCSIGNHVAELRSRPKLSQQKFLVRVSCPQGELRHRAEGRPQMPTGQDRAGTWDQPGLAGSLTSALGIPALLPHPGIPGGPQVGSGLSGREGSARGWLGERGRGCTAAGPSPV